MRMRPWIWIFVAAALAAPTVACLPAMDFGPGNADGGADAGAAAGAVAIDEQRILGSVANGAYRNSPMFAAVSQTAYPSAISAATINVWVTASDYAAYTRIAPDKSGSGSSLQPGAIVVREVLDANGAVAKVTLMAKGPAGYNPTVGDFWFGVIKPDGTPMVDNGVTQMGKVQSCFGCHVPRASDGYLFGVPESDRRSGGVTGGGSDLGVGDLGVRDAGVASDDMCTGGRRGNGKCGGDTSDGGNNQ